MTKRQPENPGRVIAYLWVPHMGARVAQQADPKLAAGPLALLDEQYRVLAVDARAAQEGVRPGIPGLKQLVCENRCGAERVDVTQGDLEPVGQVEHLQPFAVLYIVRLPGLPAIGRFGIYDAECPAVELINKVQRVDSLPAVVPALCVLACPCGAAIGGAIDIHAFIFRTHVAPRSPAFSQADEGRDIRACFVGPGPGLAAVRGPARAIAALTVQGIDEDRIQRRPDLMQAPGARDVDGERRRAGFCRKRLWGRRNGCRRRNAVHGSWKGAVKQQHHHQQ